MIKYVIQSNDSIFLHKRKYWSKSNNAWIHADLCSPFVSDFFGVYYNTRQDAEKELENIFIENPLATVESVF